jgi:UDP-4-amino-4,6-dideoxy-N-acetyl-beta-L-altrosamine N-acetyltransferase
MTSSGPRAINLVPLIQLDSASQMAVRDIRNEENVRRWMFTDHVIGESEHRGWIERLKADDRQIVFAVLDDDSKPLGLVSVNAIDRLHRKAEWAYYLTESERGGLGPALEFAILNLIFGSLGIEKLNCEVIEGNGAVVKLHKRFLFVEEGFRRSNIVKDGIRVGVHILGLTKEDWVAGKAALADRYGSVFDKFAVAIQWRDDGTSPVR